MTRRTFRPGEDAYMRSASSIGCESLTFGAGKGEGVGGTVSETSCTYFDVTLANISNGISASVRRSESCSSESVGWSKKWSRRANVNRYLIMRSSCSYQALQRLIHSLARIARLLSAVESQLRHTFRCIKTCAFEHMCWNLYGRIDKNPS